jgi:putative DNA primase/helicase
VEGNEVNKPIAPTEMVSTRRLEPTIPNDIVTEDNAAAQFVELRNGELRFCHSQGAWFRYNGFFWVKDQTGVAFHWARKLARELAQDQSDRHRYITSKVSFAAAVERYARHDPQIAVTADYWDRDPFLLGTPAGTVDLRTGELRASVPDDGITKSISVAPLDEPCPLWLRFLNEATGNDGELIRFLQQWCGYALTGSTREHALVFVYGPGGNGKSVFLNIVAAILRDYAATAAMDTFTASKSDKHPTDLAMLRGARLVTASETEEGRAWAEARIKQMTGGDRVSARFMRQDFFEFTPQFKLMIVGNHKPVLRNVDDAARRRFNIVPFLVKPAQPDRELEQKLMHEAPGILQWMIQGCLDWQAHGLVRPASVKAATESYFSDQDLIGQWLEDCCDVQPGKASLWDKTANLFESWTEYATKAGEQPGSTKAFSETLLRRGFERYRAPHDGSRAFRFIRVKTSKKIGSDFG